MYQSFSDRESYLSSLSSIVQTPSLRTLRIFDENMEDFASLEMVASLHKFLLASRSHAIKAVLLDDQAMRRDMPRLFNELKLFAHACEFRRCNTVTEKIEDSFVIADNNHLLLRPNRKLFHGGLYLDEEEKVSQYDKRFSELEQESDRVAFYSLGL